MTDALVSPSRTVSVGPRQYTLSGSFATLRAVQEAFNQDVVRLLFRVMDMRLDEVARLVSIGSGAPADEIGQATAIEMQSHSLVLWPFHGVFGSGPTLDETFGLIDTAEKSAEVLVKVLSMGGMKQTITREELIALGKRFGVTPMQSALDLYP